MNKTRTIVFLVFFFSVLTSSVFSFDFNIFNHNKNYDVESKTRNIFGSQYPDFSNDCPFNKYNYYDCIVACSKKRYKCNGFVNSKNKQCYKCFSNSEINSFDW